MSKKFMWIARSFVAVYALSTGLFLVTSCKERTAETKDIQPIKVIFDTDMGPDYDDVGAITLLHALADSGKAEILATIASTRFEGVAAVLDVLNTYFNRPDLPVGVAGAGALTLRDFQHWTDTLIARYPHSITRNDQAEDAVALYRRILAKQPENSVTIVTVGFLTNIAALLKSSPDEHSSLSGDSLVHNKVLKLVCMAGKFPSGSEFNVKEDAAASGYVFQNFRKPILFSGVEIGQQIKTGLPLVKSDISDSPVKDVFRISIPMAEEDSAGRMSWDQTAVLAAVKGINPYYQTQSGTITVDQNGFNNWRNDNGRHSYLILAKPASEVQNAINNLMLHEPSGSTFK